MYQSICFGTLDIRIWSKIDICNKRCFCNATLIIKHFLNEIMAFYVYEEKKINIFTCKNVWQKASFNPCDINKLWTYAAVLSVCHAKSLLCFIQHQRNTIGCCGCWASLTILSCHSNTCEWDCPYDKQSKHFIGTCIPYCHFHSVTVSWRSHLFY